jgi:hypothetical protein
LGDVLNRFDDESGVEDFGSTKPSEDNSLDIVTLLRGSTVAVGSSVAEATSRVAWHQSGRQM